MPNQHLFAAADGDRDTRVTIDMTHQSFGDGGDRFPAGTYEFLIKDASWVNKKDRAGKNLRVVLNVSGPEEYKGRRVVAYHPAPAGEEGSKDVVTAQKTISNLLASIASGSGNLEKARQQSNLEFCPRDLMGKRCFGTAAEEEYQGRFSSKLQWYVDAERYAEAPGPEMVVETAKAQPNVTAGTPEILGGNGTSATPPAESTRTAASDVSAFLG